MGKWLDLAERLEAEADTGDNRDVRDEKGDHRSSGFISAPTLSPSIHDPLAIAQPLHGHTAVAADAHKAVSRIVSATPRTLVNAEDAKEPHSRPLPTF